MQKPIPVYSSEYVMNTQFEANRFIVYGMLYSGLYLLAGAPKVGKSWLALDLCLSVASGEQFLRHDTNKSEVLYLSLEDTLLRLQNRLYELTEEPHENLKLAVEAPTIGNGLEEQIVQWSQDNPNLKPVALTSIQFNDLAFSSHWWLVFDERWLDFHQRWLGWIRDNLTLLQIHIF